MQSGEAPKQGPMVEVFYKLTLNSTSDFSLQHPCGPGIWEDMDTFYKRGWKTPKFGARVFQLYPRKSPDFYS